MGKWAKFKGALVDNDSPEYIKQKP